MQSAYFMQRKLPFHRTIFISMSKEEESSSSEFMNEQGLRRVVSDMMVEFDKLKKDHEVMVQIKEMAKPAECKCCGILEDCTQNYIDHVRDSHCGEWVCGLCSEAVKERMLRDQNLTTEEAISAQTDFCQKFNSTTRLNPKLSLAWTMRDIVKRRSTERRRSMEKTSAGKDSKLVRTSSCFPMINFD